MMKMKSRALKEFTLASLQREQPAMTGILSKLLSASGSSGGKVWKPCYLLLTSMGELFIYKADSSSESLPITCLSISGSVGFFDPLLQGWILHVMGEGMTSEGRLLNRKWVFQCSNEETLDQWVFAIDEVCPTNKRAMEGHSSTGSVRSANLFDGLPSPTFRGDNELSYQSFDIQRAPTAYSDIDSEARFYSVDVDRNNIFGSRAARGDNLRKTPSSGHSGNEKKGKWFDFFVN
ncbi:hypothetical protein BDR26DRAFT_1004998 [Obelidium mucronatum]|nr:hypothetical protein BDR26DRAFT_1004998 [Obelidium mucronatum]